MKFNDQHKTFIVIGFACFKTAKQIIQEMKEEFGVEPELHSVLYYHPEKTTGRKDKLGKKWKLLFETARAQYISDLSSVGLAHQRYRMEIQQQLLNREIEKGLTNKGLVLDILERGAKEVGGAYTNRRELSGPKGGSIPVAVEDRNKELAAAMLKKLMDKGMKEAEARASLIAMGVNERDIPTIRDSKG